MNRPTRTALTAALSLIMSAIVAQPADIKISSLPFNITAPGTYVLTGNLSTQIVGATGDINISTNIAGPVVLDLKGFSITGPGYGSGGSLCISIGSISP